MKIALISCTKLKQSYSCQAQEMYLPSQLFKKVSTYVNKRYSNWFILSAKYGLLEPTNVIDPYNLTLNNMSKKELIEWSVKVFIFLSSMYVLDIDFYTGINYRKYLIPMLEEKEVVCNVPLKGLGIGQQLHYFKEHN